MVENITNYVCRGVAGRRSGAIQGLVYHNDAGSIYATAKHYVEALSRMSNKQLENGFAHGYIDYLTNARTENLLNMAWHTANTRGNAYFIGLEACQSMGSSVEQFLKNEQEMFKQGAAILKANGLPVNESTIMLHMEFSATACPHRSWELHGRSIKSVKAYFIQQTKLYYDGKNGNSSTVKPDTSKPTPAQPSTIKVGSIVKVKQAVNYDNGKSFKTYYDKYTVLNLDNNRAVIGVSGKVTSAIHTKNLELISNANTGAANPSPTQPVSTNWKRVAETGTFICGTAVAVKNEPTVKSTQVALYEKGGAVNYDSYVVNDGHVWISYIAGSGTRRYMAVRETGKDAWGTFI